MRVYPLGLRHRYVIRMRCVRPPSVPRRHGHESIDGLACQSVVPAMPATRLAQLLGLAAIRLLLLLPRRQRGDVLLAGQLRKRLGILQAASVGQQARAHTALSTLLPTWARRSTPGAGRAAAHGAGRHRGGSCWGPAHLQVQRNAAVLQAQATCGEAGALGHDETEPGTG